MGPPGIADTPSCGGGNSSPNPISLCRSAIPGTQETLRAQALSEITKRAHQHNQKVALKVGNAERTRWAVRARKGSLMFTLKAASKGGLQGPHHPKSMIFRSMSESNAILTSGSRCGKPCMNMREHEDIQGQFPSVSPSCLHWGVPWTASKDNDVCPMFSHLQGCLLHFVGFLPGAGCGAP